MVQLLSFITIVQVYFERRIGKGSICFFVQLHQEPFHFQYSVVNYKAEIIFAYVLLHTRPEQ